MTERTEGVEREAEQKGSMGRGKREKGVRMGGREVDLGGTSTVD